MPFALFNIPQLKNRYYSVATTSTSGAPISQVVVASRCKYLGGWFINNNLQASKANDSFDVVTITAATSLTSGLVTPVSSGVTITTSTGTLGTAFGGQGGTPGATTATYLNPGDSIVTLGSTCFAGWFTHVVGEF